MQREDLLVLVTALGREFSGQQPWVYTDGVFPGGVRMRCQTCGDLWLEAEG